MSKKRLNQDLIAAPKADKQPNMVSFLSGKGGVGKSVICYNLGVVLSLQKQKTLIVDVDPNFGNQHLLANTILQSQLFDATDRDRPVQETIVKLNDYLHLISASDKKSTPSDKKEITKFLERLKPVCQNYAFILIDTPTGDVETISRVVSVADMNLIIITPDITAIADGYGLFKYLLKSKKKRSVGLLVNLAESGIDFEYIYQKFAAMTDRFLGETPQPAGYLLENKAVAESTRRQKSVFELPTASDSAEQFLKLSEFLTGTESEIGFSGALKRKQSINSRALLADIRE